MAVALASAGTKDIIHEEGRGGGGVSTSLELEGSEVEKEVKSIGP